MIFIKIHVYIEALKIRDFIFSDKETHEAPFNSRYLQRQALEYK